MLVRQGLAALAAAILAVAPGAAADDWLLARTPNFVVVSDAGEASTRRVARQFEVFRELLRAVLNVRGEATRPLVILALKDEAGLDRLLPRHAKGRVAGIFVSGADMHHIALRTDLGGASPHSVVFHEYVHLLVRTHFRRVPLWLNEGLAEFYATVDVRATDVEFGQMLPWHVRLLRGSTPMALDKLLAVDTGSPEYNEGTRVGLFYAQSAALTHYFMMADRGAHRGELLKYLALLGEGASEADAQARAFGGLARLDKAFTRYIGQLMFYGMRAPLRTEPPAATIVPLREADALAVRAQFLVHYGAREEARALADQALARDGGLGLAHEVRGRVLASEGRRGESLAAFARAAELSPSDPIVHYRLGVTWAGRPDAADRERRERSLRRAVELQPRFAPARSALAELLEQGGRAAQAVEHARAALDIEPGELRHAVRLAAALRAAGQKGEADAIEADLLRSAPSDPALLALIAWSFRDDGRAAEAEAIVRRVRAERPGEHQPTMLLAAMLARDKRHDEAEALYREAIALRPEDPAALNDLGYMNADRNVRVAEALQLIDRALRKWPEAPHLLDSRGWALFRLGRLEEAERELRRALAKTGDPDVLDHLGDVLAARGRRTEAEAEWRKALGFDTLDDDHRKKIEAKLAGAREG
jgi:Flp pilus assembly protein TadD